VAVEEYTFTHKQYTEYREWNIHNNWVDTQWQQYSTHLRTNSTQNTENGTYMTIGLTPGGSSTTHIYTQTVHRIQRTEHT
jgi:hypothetical protein